MSIIRDNRLIVTKCIHTSLGRKNKKIGLHVLLYFGGMNTNATQKQTCQTQSTTRDAIMSLYMINNVIVHQEKKMDIVAMKK